MEMKLSNLPSSATYSPSPWNSLLWHTYNDSINYQWNEGQPSATEKYATAFGLDVKTLMDSHCGIRAEASSGYCIDAAYGLSHAWAPASVLEKEPKCPVTFSGVTFEPLDIKALLMGIYDTASIPTVFTGVRYSGGNFSVDNHGRNEDPAYRDLNPGFFHIAATNILGKHKATFIVDRYASYEVWSQPVDGFTVHEQKVMTPEEAAQTFYRLQTYPWNEAAKSIVHTGTGADYEYLLEMDDVDQIIGGDQLWTP
ncbi:glycoprotein elicitor-like protein [Phytophthora infestans T30-4]|uniref:Glycoprotein elicitor-like protein n=1 Tax=Phytophthora infestans (strain T30-4) TaxID=403677 RepID=D0NLU9_PHYIT|nr:glycoprotein elicitor-like protein [Phytophthora infestans T30-4]EEY60646.1 glycoprotein elicitor-like protein [Phytophthora infestans T30-4]|eukprot:XP_002900019.1 glycoprotein elicitor-like protein [Phytophthora infestans T30-4]